MTKLNTAFCFIVLQTAAKAPRNMAGTTYTSIRALFKIGQYHQELYRKTTNKKKNNKKTLLRIGR